MNSSERYLSRNCSSNSSHDTSSTTMFICGRSVFHHRRALPFSLKDCHADLHVGGIIAKCEEHRHLFQPCLGSYAFWGTQELGKFDLLEFPVNATYNGRCARWNLSGCRHPGLVSIQSADQCLRHALKRPHHPHDIANCDLLLSENLLASLGFRPLRRGCYWRCRASSPSTPSFASTVSSNHNYRACTQSTRSAIV
jgi:hypothetical protein